MYWPHDRQHLRVGGRKGITTHIITRYLIERPFWIPTSNGTFFIFVTMFENEFDESKVLLQIPTYWWNGLTYWFIECLYRKVWMTLMCLAHHHASTDASKYWHHRVFRLKQMTTYNHFENWPPVNATEVRDSYHTISCHSISCYTISYYIHRDMNHSDIDLRSICKIIVCGHRKHIYFKSPWRENAMMLIFCRVARVLERLFSEKWLYVAIFS